jgi:YesN/AraC family two-component response regulator
MATILVVDDEDHIRSMLKELFDSSYTCHVAETAEQALLNFKVQDYDAVLTDISMPGMSGLELLGHIRQSQPDTPVIVMSGISDEGHALGLMKMGAFYYLMKPFDIAEVEEVVKRAVKWHQELRARRSSSDREAVPSEQESTGELMVLERQWAEAYRNRNIAVLDRIWAEDFVYTSPLGEYRDKEQAQEMIRSEVSYEFFVTFDVHGNVFGDTAVSTGRAIVKGEYMGRDISGEYRYSNTYAKRRGEWRAIASHLTRVEHLL